MIDKPRKTNSATTYSARAMTKVSYGGRKKKLNTRNETKAAKIPGPSRPIAAASTTTTKKVKPTVIGSRLSRHGA